MKSLVSLLVTGCGILALAGACDDGDPAACEGDADCPQGFICRESICASLGADAGTSSTFDAGPTTCSSDGLFCNLPEDCCSRACTTGRCGSTPVPVVTCRGIYEACTNDCCDGLTCRSGTCR